MKKWIKQLEELSISGYKNVNFLYNKDKFFISDNHLTATWCWLQKIDTNKKYNFFHIDRHYDLLLKPNVIQSEVISKGINLQNISFSEYEDLKFEHIGGRTTPIFRFDNYIGNLITIYPNLIDKAFFATHKDGSVIKDFITYEVEICELTSNISYWINNINENKWILNLDIDYFFNKDRDSYQQILTDEYIILLCNEIIKCLNNIEVVTIALSPEFCGGWDKTLRIANIISDRLNLDFKIKSY